MLLLPSKAALRGSGLTADCCTRAGPVTILNWSFPRKDISRSAQAYQLALALREEVADLESAGCKVIQVPLACSPPTSHTALCAVSKLLHHMFLRC